MKSPQISKKKFYNTRFKNPRETVHFEGKYLCDCRVRNYRRWLWKKRYGWKEEDEIGQVKI